MNFTQLQSLIALVETGSFTEAAYAVDLTQSTVSHALTALERELGVTLLERNRKGVVALTSVGQKIIPRVREVLAQIDAIEEEAKAAQGTVRGKLRLGIMPSLCPYLLAGVLTRFQQLYPSVEVVLFEGRLQDVHEWIEGNIIDVGVVTHPTNVGESTLITTDELCTIVPAGHRLSTRAAVTLCEVLEEELIMPRAGCELLQGAGLASDSRPRVRYHASDGTTILAMVRQGLGISLLPRMMLPEQIDGMLTIPLDPPMYVPIGLAVRSQDKASPATTLFVQAALAWAQEQAR